MVNFASIADKKPEDIKRPPVPPRGTYIGPVVGYTLGEVSSSKGDWEILTFTIQLQTPQDDVDSADIEAYEGDLSKARVQHKFMFDKNDEAKFTGTENRLKTFLQKHIGCWEDDQPLKQGLENSKNQFVMVSINHRQDPNDPEIFYADVTGTASAE